MFPLKQSTRRFLGRAAFFLGCLAPTVCVAAWCVWRASPQHVRSERQRVSAWAGVPVSLEAVEHPRPGGVTYHDLTLSDPESGRPLFTFSSVTLERSDELLKVSATRLELEPGGAAFFRRFLDELLRGRHAKARTLRVHVEELSLAAGERPAKLSDVWAGLEYEEDAVHGYASFRHGESPEAVRLRLVRNRAVQPATLGLELRTGDTALPCGLLTPWCDASGWLGDEAKFRGYLLAGNTPEGWGIEFSGRLTQVDLDRLVTREFAPHQLSGTAEIDLERALARGGRVQHADGSLLAGPGFVSQSLVASAGAVGLEVDPRAESLGGLVPYERLGLRFSLRAGGLVVRGEPGEGQREPVLSDEDGALAWATGRPVETASLCEMLSPEPARRLASAAAQQLLGRLPLPPR